MILGTATDPNSDPARPGFSPAGNRFQLGLLRGLAENGADVTSVSVFPVATFPRTKILLIGKRRLDLVPGVASFQVPYVNLPGLKQVTYAFTLLITTLAWHRRNRHRKRIVLAYNMMPTYAYPMFLARSLAGGKLGAVIADVPQPLEDTPFQAGERSSLKTTARLAPKLDAVVALTTHIVTDYAPKVPSIVVEGGVEPVPLAGTQGPESSRPYFLYSGSLGAFSGIPLLLEAMKTFTGDCDLVVTGTGPLAATVVIHANHDSRIRYLGSVNRVRLWQIQCGALALVNPRLSENRKSRYTFPSKLYEYMLTGRPVISTLLPGMPGNLSSMIVPVVDETSHGMRSALEVVFGMDEAQRQALGEAARTHVSTNCNWKAQAARILKLIESVT